MYAAHTTLSADTYHQFLDERFSLRHHVLQLSDDLQVLLATLPVPELVLGSFQPARQDQKCCETERLTEQRTFYLRSVLKPKLELVLVLQLPESQRPFFDCTEFI